MAASELIGDELVVRIPVRGEAAVGRPGSVERAEDPRVVRSRAAVVEAATLLFLERGYVQTSVDDIASRAAVSKRTVYNHFSDKERLFTQIVLGVTATAERFTDGMVESLAAQDDVPKALHDVARQLLASVTRPEVIRLRRLISAESVRFPELAREYHRRAPGRVVTGLADAFSRLTATGALDVSDARRAAEHFAFLVVGSTLDRVMFDGEAAVPGAEEQRRIADDAVAVFLAAYRKG